MCHVDGVPIEVARGLERELTDAIKNYERERKITDILGASLSIANCAWKLRDLAEAQRKDQTP